jgi:hypothetical protein
LAVDAISGEQERLAALLDEAGAGVTGAKDRLFRGRFMGYAARVMRNLLVDLARVRRAQPRMRLLSHSAAKRERRRA